MSINAQARSLRTAQLIAAVATLTACGQEAPAPTSSGDDSAAAYAVVSAQLEACENQQDSCMSACGGDPSKMAQCNSQSATCQAGAQTSEAQARAALQHDADRCTNGADDDAGVDEGKGGAMNGCIAQHTPKLPKCVASLVSCLHDAGKAHGGARLFAIGGCLRDADVCFLDELAAARHAHHGQEAGASGAAGAGVAGSAGAAGSSGAGGSTTAVTAGSGGAAGGGGSACSCPSSHEPKRHDPFVPWWLPKR